MASGHNDDGSDDRPDLNTIFANDIFFSFRKYPDQPFTFVNYKTPAEIIDATVDSDAGRKVITKICQSENKSETEARNDVVKILKEVGHTLNSYSIRFFSLLLTPICHRIFRHVYINKSGIKQLKEISKLGHVVYVPSHNSYFDFLLVSLCLFAVGLPLPVIATAEDFLGMAMVRRLLRQSGAFFMRRSFAKDECYKSLFKEYVHQLVSCAASHLEFFVEGTRSRTGKGLQPRTGLLSMVNEAYFSCRSPDIFYCPVSVSYECIPEGSLHTYEVLGVPKPKETSTGLLKAKGILSYNFGSVNLHFGRCVSLEDISKPLIDRRLYNCLSNVSKATKDELSRNERKLNRDFARMLVHEQQSNMTLYLTSVVAAILLPRKESLEIDTLEFQCRAVMGLIKESSAILEHNVEINRKAVVNSVRQLNPIVEYAEDKVMKLPTVSVNDKLVTSVLGQSFQNKDTLGHVLTHTSLSRQRNKLLHRCSNAAFIAISLRACKGSSCDIGDIRSGVELIHKLMNVELVYHPNADLFENMERALDILETSSCIKIHSNSSGRSIEIVDSEAGNFLFSFLHDLMYPFLEAYWFVGQSMLAESAMKATPVPALAKKLQQQAARGLEQGLLRAYEALSLHTLANALKWFIQAKALVAHKDSNLIQVVTGQRPDELLSILQSIGNLTDLTSETIMSSRDSIKLKGKL